MAPSSSRRSKATSTACIWTTCVVIIMVPGGGICRYHHVPERSALSPSLPFLTVLQRRGGQPCGRQVGGSDAGAMSSCGRSRHDVHDVGRALRRADQQVPDRSNVLVRTPTRRTSRDRAILRGAQIHGLGDIRVHPLHPWQMSHVWRVLGDCGPLPRCRPEPAPA
jgi:hypothetical protein